MSDGKEVRQQLADIDEAETCAYLQVPRSESDEGHRDMQDFIRTVRDERLQDLLDVAIQGRGAFRRFKDVLERKPVERQRWFDFQASRLEARALGSGWLKNDASWFRRAIANENVPSRTTLSWISLAAPARLHSWR